jgi:DNA-binding YbaB/EbfC family protein
MSGFDLEGLTDMLGGFQQQLESLKSQVAKSEHTGEAGGGVVKVTATGENKIVSISIAEAAMADRELLEDLVRAAANEALRKAQEASASTLSKLADQLPLPPGLLGR